MRQVIRPRKYPPIQYFKLKVLLTRQYSKYYKSAGKPKKIDKNLIQGMLVLGCVWLYIVLNFQIFADNGMEFFKDIIQIHASPN